MPPDGYTTITISEETAGELPGLAAKNDPTSMAEAVEYATAHTRDPKVLPDAELAHLLYQRLTDEN